MNNDLHRAQLGLAIKGPFSRNRRRPIQWINAVPYLISVSLMTAALAFLLFFIL